MREWKELLSCNLDDEERDRQGRALASLEAEYREVEQAAKDTAKLSRERLKELREDMRTAADEARLGVGLRLVECREVLIAERGLVSIVRTDTGEVVRARAVTDDDRQLSMVARIDEALES